MARKGPRPTVRRYIVVVADQPGQALALLKQIASVNGQEVSFRVALFSAANPNSLPVARGVFLPPSMTLSPCPAL